MSERGPRAVSARLRALCNAAARLAESPGDLIDALVATTGLSPEGVALGLTEHLERHPSDDELAALCANAERAERVHVILSANVFTAGLRAIALAIAASDEVTVRPSTREPHFASRLLAALDDPRVRADDHADARHCVGGEVHVYGRDETIARVREQVAPGVVVRGHGAGLGVASIDEGDDLDTAATALARDVIAFDQRGCLSPRVALVTGGRAHDFAVRLHDALADAERRVPRGRLSPAERAEAARYTSTLVFAGARLRGDAHEVGVSTRLFLPPPGRHVHVLDVGDAGARAAAVAPIARHVVAVGASAPRPDWAPTHARCSPLGRMQRPPLDGPVDRRGA